MNVEDGYKCKGGMSTNVDKGCSSRMDTNVLLAGLYSQVVIKKKLWWHTKVELI